MKKYKKLLIFVLSFMTLSLFACGAPNDNGSAPSVGTLPPTVENSQPKDSEKEQPTVELVYVSDIVNVALGETDYRDEFNGLIIDIVGEKYGVLNLVSIDFEEFSIAREGKIVLSVVLKGAENEEPIIITYEGDTTKYEALYRLAYEKEDYIAEILAENTLTMESVVFKDSKVHLDIAETFAGVKNDFNSGKTAFANLSAEDFKEPEPEKPIEYVTVQSIVDEVFKDVDVDADVKETAQAIFTTSVATGIKMNNLFATDYDKISGDFVIYTEMELPSGTKAVNSFTIKNCYSSCSDYLDMSSDMDEYIAVKIAEKGMNLTDKIEDGSREESELVSYFEETKKTYNAQKEMLESASQSAINYKTILKVLDFDATKMSELGITSMNAFAEALLNNKNGDGYDQVTGWTMDDVVATYVGEFSVQNIYGESDCQILVVFENVMEEFVVKATRIPGDTTDRYSMFLSDNPNVDFVQQENFVTYGENAIAFDENGQRIEN